MEYLTENWSETNLFEVVIYGVILIVFLVSVLKDKKRWRK